MSDLICEHFNLDIREIRYYNSIPDIELGDEVYYKHMVFLAKLKKQGIIVNTRKLKKIKEEGKIIRIEKGIDVMISADMVSKALVENRCDCCVLITGDSDFIPVMQLIKKAGKEVLTVSVIKGYARELLQGDFRFWISLLIYMAVASPSILGFVARMISEISLFPNRLTNASIFSSSGPILFKGFMAP